MKPLELLLIALSLSLDAFAVAVAGGATMKVLHVRNALKMALFFGGFQALMPVLGWLAGVGLRDYISGVDHWIAFGLLCGMGGKMIYGAVKIREKNECPTCPFDTGVLFILAIATSIDAMAVGLTFSMLAVSILTPVLVIGLVTFGMTAAGVKLGAAGAHFFEDKIEAAGGAVLIAIGCKILLEHL